MKPSEITREYIAGILCAMQVAGDDEASAAIEKFIVQLEEENAALKEETERLRDGMRDVRKYIAPMHTAYDMLLVLLAQGSE